MRSAAGATSAPGKKATQERTAAVPASSMISTKRRDSAERMPLAADRSRHPEPDILGIIGKPALKTGTVTGARIQLQSTAGAGTPAFTFGCASGNGTAACGLGTVDASSAQRLFEAEVTVPLTATTIKAVSLTVTGSAANLATDPAASASLTVLATGTAAGASLSPLPNMTSSVFAFPTATASSGGNAADLFPTVGPSSPVAGVRPVANVSASSGGNAVSSAVAEGAGLSALGLAMVLAITRVSLRRPAPRPAASSAVAASPPPGVPAERQENPG